MRGRERLHELVDRFPRCRVLVYGDLVLDRFILGSPKRISREAPVLILRFEEQRDVPGGGANAMANILTLGGQAMAVGVVGDDEEGKVLRQALDALGGDVSRVVVAPGLRTVTKVRILAGGPSALKHQVARYDIEDQVGDGELKEALMRALDEVAPWVHAVAVSDYGYGAVFAQGVQALRSQLGGGVPVVADSRFALPSLGPVDGATPNLEELSAHAGHFPQTDREVAEAAENLRRKLRARFVVATRGSQGLTLVERAQPPFHLPVFGTDQVADVTGAGDTVLATLTLALAAGGTPKEAAVLANLAGGIVVMKAGTATVSAEELHRAVDMAPFIHD
ncbi:MAG: PfkB family carbohydrate kinase [Thermoanaerobaculum sp.]|nr:PfkB family carbohydrate kinase [Thermoanaerobaculum sp.]MDW7968407.1 PfkB family carbohydrate kinase [Thermoanaerobaculum sp.]